MTAENRNKLDLAKDLMNDSRTLQIIKSNNLLFPEAQQTFIQDVTNIVRLMVAYKRKHSANPTIKKKLELDSSRKMIIDTHITILYHLFVIEMLSFLSRSDVNVKNYLTDENVLQLLNVEIVYSLITKKMLLTNLMDILTIKNMGTTDDVLTMLPFGLNDTETEIAKKAHRDNLADVPRMYQELGGGVSGDVNNDLNAFFARTLKTIKIPNTTELTLFSVMVAEMGKIKLAKDDENKIDSILKNGILTKSNASSAMSYVLPSVIIVLGALIMLTSR